MTILALATIEINLRGLGNVYGKITNRKPEQINIINKFIRCVRHENKKN